MTSTGREWEERQRALQAQKDIMARHYSALKQAMDHFRAQQNTRLKHLSANRYETQRSSTMLGITYPKHVSANRYQTPGSNTVICIACPKHVPADR